jgi:hypothetical protein
MLSLMNANTACLSPSDTAAVFADPISYLASLGLVVEPVDDWVPAAA